MVKKDGLILETASDGPPSIEWNGSERRFCPLQGAEGVVKTIEEDRDERWVLP